MNYRYFKIEENPDVLATLELIDSIFSSLSAAYGDYIDSKTLFIKSIEILNLRSKLDFIFVTDYENNRGDSDVQ